MLIRKSITRILYFFLFICFTTMLANMAFVTITTLNSEIEKGREMARMVIESYINYGKNSNIINYSTKILQPEINTTFTILADSTGNIICRPNNEQPADVQSILSYMKTHDHYPDLPAVIINVLSGKHYTTASAVTVSDGSRYIAISDTDYRDLHKFLITQLLWLLALTLPPVVFIFFSSRRLQRKISAIVNSTTQQAQAVANGNYSIRLSYSEESELTAIADSFNTMTGKVREKTAALADFAGNVAHEIQNPLSGLKLSAIVLSEYSNLPSDACVLSRRMLDEIRRTEQIVQSLLSLARLDRENFKETLTFSPVDIQPILQKILSGHSPQINAKNISVEKNITIGQLYANTELLSQLLENIIGNALKFVGENGKITIAVTPGAGTTILSVSDNGPGIAASDLPQIFNRFYRAGQHSANPGSGLGLSIVKKISELLDAKISATSSPGIRTTFSFEFPDRH